MKHFFTLILALVLILPQGFAHKKASWNIIVDTDGAADDFRMLQLIMASPDFNLNAIVTSDGVLSPRQSAAKIKGMMIFFHHEGVPVASGKSLNENFIHRKFANSLDWPGKESRDFSGNATQLMLESLSMHSRKNIIIASGPLTNIAELFRKYPESVDKIDRIIWYHNPDRPGMNYLRDSLSAQFVNRKFPGIEFVSSGDQPIYLGSDFFSYLESLRNKYAEAVITFCKQPALASHEFLGKYPVWDECLPLYLLFPDSFSGDGHTHTPNDPGLNINMLAVLHTRRPVQGVIWQKNATGQPWLRPDIYAVSDSIINKYGYNEFQVVAMTSEFHGHLGIYSIIGAKMGLRAMQYFCVGLDELEVYSRAGKYPPLSCMHDGLQFSTGASLGYGTIHVVEDSVYSPEAIFDYNGRKIEIRLKPEYREKFEADIKQSIQQYGLLTDDYWEEIRRLGILYWRDMDKLDLFEIIELN